MCNYKPKKNAALILLFAMCLTLVSSFVFCGEPNHTIILSSPPEGWPPYTITDEPAFGDGIMTDVMKEVARVYGWNIDQIFYPEKRSLILLNEGHIHAYPKAREWVDDPELYAWTDPVVISTDILIFSAKKYPNGPPKTLNGLNIGTILGYVYPTLAPQFKAGTLNRRNANSTERLIHMLERGHVDAAVTNSYVASWIIKNSPDLSYGDFHFGTTPVDSAPYRFAFTKRYDYSQFIDDFNRELAVMKTDGRFEAILRKYRD